MTWPIFASSSGIAATLKDVYLKKALALKSYNNWTVMFLGFLFALPILLIYWAWSGFTTAIKDAQYFFTALMVLVIIEVIAQWFYQKAIERQPLAVVAPFSHASILLMFPVSFVILHIVPSLFAVLSAIVLIGGLFILVLEAEKDGLKAFIRTIKSNGVGYMLIVMILWSITPVLQKYGSEKAGVPLFALFYIGGIIAVLFLIHAARKFPLYTSIIRNARIKHFLPIGLFGGISYIAQYTALNRAQPSTVLALIEAMAVFYLLWDKMFFKEKISARRVAGLLLAIMGVIGIIVF